MDKFGGKRRKRDIIDLKYFGFRIWDLGIGNWNGVLIRNGVPIPRYLSWVVDFPPIIQKANNAK